MTQTSNKIVIYVVNATAIMLLHEATDCPIEVRITMKEKTDKHTQKLKLTPIKGKLALKLIHKSTADR